MQVMASLVSNYGPIFTFIICTGLSQSEARQLAERTGAAGFLCKPYQAGAVLAMIKQHADKPPPSVAGAAGASAPAGE